MQRVVDVKIKYNIHVLYTRLHCGGERSSSRCTACATPRIRIMNPVVFFNTIFASCTSRLPRSTTPHPNKGVFSRPWRGLFHPPIHVLLISANPTLASPAPASPLMGGAHLRQTTACLRLTKKKNMQVSQTCSRIDKRLVVSLRLSMSSRPIESSIKIHLLWAAVAVVVVVCSRWHTVRLG